MHCELINLYILDSWRLLWEALLKLATDIEYGSDEAHAHWMVIESTKLIRVLGVLSVEMIIHPILRSQPTLSCGQML